LGFLTFLAFVCASFLAFKIFERVSNLMGFSKVSSVKLLEKLSIVKKAVVVMW